jgi:hypothetical protein
MESSIVCFILGEKTPVKYQQPSKYIEYFGHAVF